MDYAGEPSKALSRQAADRTMPAMPAFTQLPRPPALLWLSVAIVSWAGLAVLAAQLPADALGQDLRVLVDAAGRWNDGTDLYLPLPPGSALAADTLFYSYPPIVAQALAPIAGLPFPVIFVGWTIGAAATLWAAARRLSRGGRAVAWPTLALAPLVFPFALAVLQGNLNEWFAGIFGLVLAAVLVAGRGASVAAGAGLAAAVLAKLHPASLAIWLLVRGIREGVRGPSVRIVATALVVGLAALAASLAVGGIEPWQDYVAFLRASSAAADIVIRLNVGPASQLALLLGLSEDAARIVQVAVTLTALAGTVVVARVVEDPVESFGWAVVASLVILPVTWYHYPVALVPIAAAAASRADDRAFRRTAALVAAAMATAAVAVAAPIVVWLAAALVLAAVRASRRHVPSAAAEAPPAARAAAP